MQDALNDGREYNVFIPARFDDLGLTLEAFRVYCHLSRRSNRESRTAYPSYTRIGEDCFRGSYPNSTKDSLKAKAIAAVTELVAFGLIRKERYNEGGCYSHNVYHLTPQSEWKQPDEINSCNVRKGRAGLTRTRNKEATVNGDYHPPTIDVPETVNGDYREEDLDPVNGVIRNRLTGATVTVNREHPPVNPTPPKGNTNQGNTNQGNTSKGISIATAIDRAIAAPENCDLEPQTTAHPDSGLRPIGNEPENNPPDFPEPQTEQPAKQPEIAEPSTPGQIESEPVNITQSTEEGSSAPKNSKKRKTGKRGTTTAEPQHEPEAFREACVRFCEIADQYGASVGCFKTAAVQWDRQIEAGATVDDLAGQGMEAFAEACAYKARLNRGVCTGIPHFCRYLSGSRQHPTPYWQVSLAWKQRQLAKAAISPVASDSTTVVGDGTWVDQWLANTGLLEWTAKHHLPGLPQFRDREVSVAIAKSWYSDAKFDPKRLSQCAIAVEAYQAYRQDLEAREAARAQMAQVPVVVTGVEAIPAEPIPSEPSTPQISVKVAYLNEQIRAGKRLAVEKEVTNSPFWRNYIRYDRELNQVVEVAR